MPEAEPGENSFCSDGRRTGEVISSGERQRIEDSITLAFEKHGYRKLSRMLNVNQGAHQDEIKEDLFLQRRALYPAMYMHILGKHSKNSTIAKHRKVIIRAALNSLIEDTFTLADLDRGSDSDMRDPPIPDHGYTGRHTQRLIREKYGDVFFEVAGLDLQVTQVGRG